MSQLGLNQDLGLVQQPQAVFDFFLGGGQNLGLTLIKLRKFGSCILVLNYAPCLML